jgi:catechol 2,3-dioxygenase-like lactoylglutathione lyase family enzyme
MIDHMGLTVSNFAESKGFYAKALGPIGYSLLMEFPASGPDDVDAAGFGASGRIDFVIGAGTPGTPRTHLAFRVKSRAEVDAFYQAGLAAGGRDNGGPGLRQHYHPNYYAAFVLDLDGHNIEVVCHEPE